MPPTPSTWAPHEAGTSIDMLVQSIHDAMRRNDVETMERRYYRLSFAVKRAAWFRPGRYGLGEQDMEDALQRFLLDLFRYLRRHTGESLVEPEHLARRIAHNAVIDLARERGREVSRPCNDDLARELEDSGVQTQRAVVDAARVEGLLQDLRARLHRYVVTYAAVARIAYPGSRAEQHVRAWFHLRFQQCPASEIARLLGVADRPDGGVATVWQWARRGAKCVAVIAREDADQDRRRVMLAAVATPR